MIDRINLLLLQFSEWLTGLSPMGIVLVAAALYALLMVGVHFGIIPRRHSNPIQLLNHN